MTASVEIVVTRQDKALLIPNQAIRFEDGSQVVYVSRPGSAELYEPVEITLGNSSETYSEVLSGNLQAGDQIVLNPLVLEGDPEDYFDSMPGSPGNGPGSALRDAGGQP
jgi:HlyD family secretion protein